MPRLVSDRIDSIVDRLDMKKRDFIEMALIDAVSRAEQVIFDYSNEDEGEQS
jgi:hypothetical protein